MIKANFQLLLLMLSLSFLSGCFLFGGPRLLWKAPIASRYAPLVQNGSVYVLGFNAGHPEDSQRLFALDAASGKQRWVTAESVKEVYGESGGYVFYRNFAEHLVQLNAQTGLVLYESPDSDSPIVNWIIRDDTMFILNAAMEAVAVDNRASKVLWRRQLPFKWGDQTELHFSGNNLIVSGNYRENTTLHGIFWALDAATGKENWYFEAPAPREFAPLEITVHESYILATNTAPLNLQTHVLDAQTGKELYPPIHIFDIYGFLGDTVYTPSGNFNLKTGQRLGDGTKWVSGIVVKDITWKCRLSSVGMIQSFTLRDSFDGDFRGHRNWTDIPPNSAIEGIDVRTGKSRFHTSVCKYTYFSAPVISNGVLFHTSIAAMKEGKSGVWAYRLPASKR